MMHARLVALFLSVGTVSTFAETIAFEDALRRVRQASPAQEAAKHQAHADKLALDRGKRHWFPKLYLDARTYRTNDPGASFFGLLEQRSVTSADFAPDPLNHPNDRWFTRGALGLDLPLYEGGIRRNDVDRLSHAAQSSAHEARAVRLEQYAQVGLSYGSIVSIRAQKAKFESLRDDIEKLMKTYQLGQRANPVGYSGLLGMKSLSNRIDGLIRRADATAKGHYLALAEMGIGSTDWDPGDVDLRSFAVAHLGEGQMNGISPRVEAYQENSLAAQAGAKMQKARFMPRLGAFAEGVVFDGSRDTALGYAGGMYLQWSLFDPSTFGSLDEARSRAAAAEEYARAAAQRERSERAGYDQAEGALRENLALLEDSDRLLAEQLRVATTLFRNGSMPALSFVEILNRRTDLIVQQGKVEQRFLEASTERLIRSPVSGLAQQGETP